MVPTAALLISHMDARFAKRPEVHKQQTEVLLLNGSLQITALYKPYEAMSSGVVGGGRTAPAHRLTPVMDPMDAQLRHSHNRFVGGHTAFLTAACLVAPRLSA